MPQLQPHLRIQREEFVNPQRPKRPPPTYKPPNPQEHSRILYGQLQQAIQQQAKTEIGGFDKRYLLRIEVRKGLRPEDLVAFGVEVLSQEEDTLILVFADEKARRTFELRLATIMQGQKATRQNILYALSAFGVWTAEDRMAWALRKEGFPQTEPFLLDVELSTRTSSHLG